MAIGDYIHLLWQIQRQLDLEIWKFPVTKMPVILGSICSVLLVRAELTSTSKCISTSGMARSLQKPITCLYRPSCGRLCSAMIRGAADDNFHVVDYDELSKEKTVEELITEIMTKMEKIAEKKKVAAEKS